MKSKLKIGRKGPNKLTLLGTTALFAAFGAQTAWAQGDDQAEDAQVENVSDNTTEEEARQDVVVVQGVRGALQTARNLKRDSDTFVDSITATDVSQLPDLSVAEALARVPGVVTQRFELGGSDGDFPSPEGSGNIIRGLQYVRSEFNGRDAFSANGGRALEWASIPPELIGAVDVFKNQRADMIEGGISGVVNLRTLEPFDRDGLVAVAIVDGTYTDLAEEWSPGFSAVLGNRWETDAGEFGLLGSFSTSELNSAIHGFQYGPLLAVDNQFNPGSTIALPGGWQARDVEFQRERDSYYLAGQWRAPDGNTELTVKAVRVENATQSDERTFEFFTDAESFQSWEFLGLESGFNLRPFTSDGISSCNGSNEALVGDPGFCEITTPVDGGLFDRGVVSNGLRDWLGDDTTGTGSLGTPFQSLAVYEARESVTQDISANLKWRANDQWFFEFDTHYTEAEATLDRLWNGGNHFGDYAYDFTDPMSPAISLFQTGTQLQSWVPRGGQPNTAPTSLADPNTAYILYAADQFEDNTGDLFAIRGDAEYEFANEGWFDSVKFGGRFSEREQVNRSAGLNWGGIAPPWSGGYLPYANRSDPDAFEVFDFSDFQRGGVFVGDDTSVVFPSRTQMQNYDAFLDSLLNEPLIPNFVNSEGNVQIGEWTPLKQNGVIDYANRGIDGFVNEQTTNLYGMVKFGEEFENGQALSGNFGVRYVSTEISGGGVQSYGEFAEIQPGDDPSSNPRTYLPELAAYLDVANEALTIDNEYEYWLPSLNVKWDLTDEILLRFAASQSITPPNIDQLNASRNQRGVLSFQTDPNPAPGTQAGVIDIVPNEIRIEGGNPNLSPIEATNIDLSFEWYFGDDGQFTVSAFHKDIKDIIVYSETNVGTIVLDGYTIPITFAGNTNLNDGKVQGVEIAYQQFYTDLPGIFGNLGLQANLTLLESEATALPPFTDGDGDGFPDDPTTVLRYGIDELLGLSDISGNLIGIYQDDRFEARLAYNWRSDYFSSYRDFVTGNPIIQEEIGFLDASFKWDITDQVQLSVLGANLLDTKAFASQQVDQAGQRFARSSFVNDRRFEVSLRYAF
ncbi:MAG: TonB-dependent receptor [Alphaproteobacteria bacterium]|nr:TonB-dependent receptor [Alphaproteobacteria bacterium]